MTKTLICFFFFIILKSMKYKKLPKHKQNFFHKSCISLGKFFLPRSLNLESPIGTVHVTEFATLFFMSREKKA